MNEPCDIPSESFGQNVKLQAACGNNSTAVKDKAVSPEGWGDKGHWIMPPLPASSEHGVSVADWARSQTNRPKLERVLNEAMRVMVGTTKDPPTVTVTCHFWRQSSGEYVFLTAFISVVKLEVETINRLHSFRGRWSHLA